jgi:hypothetical protein
VSKRIQKAASLPRLSAGAFFTQTDTIGELHEMVRDDVRCHFAGEADQPTLIRLHFVRDEIIAA